MILIFQMGFVKPDEAQIIEVAGLFLKLWDDGYLQFSFAGKLVAEQGLACAIIIIFLCHIEPPAYSKGQVLLYAGCKQ